MPFFDLSLNELQQYRPPRSEPTNFDAFWDATLAQARAHEINATFEPYDAGLRLVEVADVTFAGYGGQPIKGWYIRPANNDRELPCIIEFIGYGGGRGFPHEHLFWPTAGYAYFIMDTRGQGSKWRQGDTADIPDGANPSVPGFMTQGILDPRHYYYRRLFTDAVRAIEAIRGRYDVDAEKIALTGISQGGGITIAASALVPDVALCMPDVPFLCEFRQAVGKTNREPYNEIVTFLRNHREEIPTVFNTLDYFDGVNFATRIKARCLFSTALMDETCPPSTVFAAYNYVDAPKEMKVYPFNDHEGGGNHHAIEKLRLVNDLWRLP